MAYHPSLGEVKKWSVDETADWAVREGFANHTAGLISREINGSRLLELQEFQVHNIFRNKALEKKFLEKLRNLSVNAQEGSINQGSESYKSPRAQNMFGRGGGRQQPGGYPPVARRPQNNVHDRPAPQQRPSGVNARPSYIPQYPPQTHLPEQYNPDDDFDDEWDDDDVEDPTLYQNNGRVHSAEMDGFKQNGPEGGYTWGEHRQENYAPNVRPLNQTGYRFENANPPVSEQQNNQSTTQTKKNYTQCIPRNQRPPPNNVTSDRRPVEPPSRSYGGGYSGDHQQPYRQPPWNQANLKSVDGGMYLQLNGQGEKGMPQSGVQQYPYNQHIQGYPGSPQQDHPPPIRERPPYPTPINYPATSHQNNISPDDQEGGDFTSGSSPHHAWRNPPPVPDQTAKQRRERSPIPSPKGPLSRENSSGSSGSSGSGNHGDPSDTSYRSGHDGFSTLKPTSHFGHGFPLRPPPPSAKPGAKSLPKMTPPKHEEPEKSTKPKFGFPVTGLRKPTPIPKPTSHEQRKSLPAVISPNLNLANVISRLPHNTPPPTSKFPYSQSPREDRRTSAPVISAGRSLESQSWYRNLDRITAEEKIKENPKEGCFVIRPGSSREHPFSLTVFSQGHTYNLRIRYRDDGNYALGSEKENERAFPTVVDMAEYYMHSPLILAERKGSVTLSGPP